MITLIAGGRGCWLNTLAYARYRNCTAWNRGGAPQKQFDVAGQHIREMREMNATDGEIQRAQIEATKNFALAALDAETKKRAELIDLAKQQRDEESKTAPPWMIAEG